MNGRHGMPPIFVDFLFLTLLAFVLLIHPPTKDETATPPGNMTVAIVWPEGNNDVDLWVIGPGQKVATGYSHKGGSLFNLLRDDLGNAADTMPLNLEHAYSRGLPAGEYIINLHCYRCSGVIPVSIEVRAGDLGSYQKLLFREEMPLPPGKERTVIRFKLDKDGKVIPSSINRVYQPLRSAKGTP